MKSGFKFVIAGSILLAIALIAIGLLIYRIRAGSSLSGGQLEIVMHNAGDLSPERKQLNHCSIQLPRGFDIVPQSDSHFFAARSSNASIMVSVFYFLNGKTFDSFVQDRRADFLTYAGGAIKSEGRIKLAGLNGYTIVRLARSGSHLLEYREVYLERAHSGCYNLTTFTDESSWDTTGKILDSSLASFQITDEEGQ